MTDRYWSGSSGINAAGTLRLHYLMAMLKTA